MSASTVEKTYSGELMVVGKQTEEAVISWLRQSRGTRGIIDFREFRLAQRLDVDCGVETIDGTMVLAEIKSDKYINENKNLFFETHRINHFVAPEKMFYLGWGWRSPAQKLIVRNPETKDAFVFDFSELRQSIGRHVAASGKSVGTRIIQTDRQKTTFAMLIPMKNLSFKKLSIPDAELPQLRSKEARP